MLSVWWIFREFSLLKIITWQITWYVTWHYYTWFVTWFVTWFLTRFVTWFVAGLSRDMSSDLSRDISPHNYITCHVIYHAIYHLINIYLSRDLSRDISPHKYRTWHVIIYVLCYLITCFDVSLDSHIICYMKYYIINIVYYAPREEIYSPPILLPWNVYYFSSHRGRKCHISVLEPGGNEALSARCEEHQLSRVIISYVYVYQKYELFFTHDGIDWDRAYDSEPKFPLHFFVSSIFTVLLLIAS